MEKRIERKINMNKRCNENTEIINESNPKTKNKIFKCEGNVGEAKSKYSNIYLMASLNKILQDITDQNILISDFSMIIHSTDYGNIDQEVDGYHLKNINVDIKDISSNQRELTNYAGYLIDLLEKKSKYTYIEKNEVERFQIEFTLLYDIIFGKYRPGKTHMYSINEINAILIRETFIYRIKVFSKEDGRYSIVKLLSKETIEKIYSEEYESALSIFIGYLEANIVMEPKMKFDKYRQFIDNMIKLYNASFQFDTIDSLVSINDVNDFFKVRGLQYYVITVDEDGNIVDECRPSDISNNTIFIQLKKIIKEYE